MNVLLMQLFPRQFHFLSHAYKGPHKLDYVDSSDQSMLEVKTKVKRADKVVVLTKFISHSQFEQIPREKIIHADSVNIANLIDVIDSIPHDEAVPSPELRTKSKAPKVVIPKKETKERPPCLHPLHALLENSPLLPRSPSQAPGTTPGAVGIRSRTWRSVNRSS